MSQLNLKPAHAAVKNYYAALHQLGQLHFDNEAQVSDAFAKLLTDCGKKLRLTFIPQFPIGRVKAKTRVIVDGALLDTFHLAHGYWEAKDEKDDLDREIKAKLDKGYPRDNIIFQAPERAVLNQAGARIADQDISKPDYLAQIVNQFFDYTAPHIEEWKRAVSEFSERVPELANAVHYEHQPEYALAKTEKPGEKLDYRVTKMRLSKDKTTLIYNDFLTLSQIPKETYDYRLGNRSALEWVIDQYQVSTDKRSGITNDPNRADDPQYILRLIGQVVTVSLETVKIVKSLPPLGIGS